jgi:hypothetical protein
LVLFLLSLLHQCLARLLEDVDDLSGSDLLPVSLSREVFPDGTG